MSRIRSFVAGAAVAVLAALAPAVPQPAAASGRPEAAGTVALWESSLQGVHGVAPDVTVRQIARVSTGGWGIRVRLGNPFGAAPVVVRDAWLGRTVAPGVATLVPGSNHRLRFHGAVTVSVPPGREVVSDAVPIGVEAGQDVAVSLYAPGSPVDDHTFPPFAYDPPASYVGTGGDTAADESNVSFPSAPVIPGSTGSTATGYHPGQIWWLDLVTGDRPAARGSVVALGDSITDGYQAVGPPGQRWTDVLADRMAAVPPAQRLAVANAGISGNTVSVQPNPYDPTGQCCGPPAPQRLERDVLSVPGVRTVFLLEGTNDLGGGQNAPPASAQQVIDAMRGIADRVHAHGLRIVGATILPMCLAAGSAGEQNRLTVNAWIRTGAAFDAVVDFDAVLRDPADPTQMVPDLRADCYHPNAAGDALLGTAIPLAALGVPAAR
ncbi:GDSL-type esterase/lipase family protein [Couchioplanes caeruleus]|uniref:GDSL-type esterase/lipase family protein n=1 Tax=Couchioplanes caeruleus TaxID=56438 RepID=UPI0020C0A3CF|nr:GDSL-type esterase/lipase family protein [Couchioplanes caeruleus]UQU61635.1 GDSL-type esterase/lipase family protein [Couchioplanes caeruleus]